MKAEVKVGLLFLACLILVVGFAYTLGALNPFSNSYELNLLYNYAGGIEVGSPVRVMGIKVGKVKSIRFAPKMKDKDGKEVKLVIGITIDRSAWDTVRKDSQFFINLAGVIGEKFIEVTPGSLSEPKLRPGGVVRGEDPPRIDQLISQSYGLAGKILEFVEKNEGSVIDTIEMMNKLVSNLNRTLVMVDKMTQNKETAQILKNIGQITGDLAVLTQKLNSPDGLKTLELMHRLIWRLEELDSKTIRKFLQDEGIRARIF